MIPPSQKLFRHHHRDSLSIGNRKKARYHRFFQLVFSTKMGRIILLALIGVGLLVISIGF